MRYFIVTYYQLPNGQFNEIMNVEEKIKNKHRREASVILDYRTREVVKMRYTAAHGFEESKDFDRISDFYKKHYETTIKSLELKEEERMKPVNDLVDAVEALANDDS
jgi:hypothetical protein